MDSSESKKFGKSPQSGSILLEFLLLLPVLLIFTIGIIDFGYGLKDVMLLAQASKAGARAASRLTSTGTPTCDELRTEASNRVLAHLQGTTTDMDNFIIDPATFATVSQDGVTFSVIRVKVRRRSLSLFGLQEILTRLPEVKVESVFRLERTVICD